MNPLYSPAQLKALCAEYHLTPSKKYGQNYLISDAPIKKMIQAGELTKDDTVVEIGPGFGVLTLALAPLVKEVIAFEIEKKLVPYWEQQQEQHGNIDIVWGNALKQLGMRAASFGDAYKVLANLPYQITSNAIRTLLELATPPERIVMMVQKEVAERICALPGEMSLLAVSVQYYGIPKIVTKVPKGSFWPSPQVDSAVVAITSIQSRANAERFFQYVRAGFHNKRKQLWKNIASSLNMQGDRVQAVLKDIVGNEKVRAEELAVAQWEAVVHTLEETQAPVS